MQILKGLGLVILAVVVIALCIVVIVITSKPTTAVSVAIKALSQTRIAGYLIPVREAAAVSVDYSKFTVKELKAMARGTGIKSWGKLRKAELVAALSVI